MKSLTNIFQDLVYYYPQHRDAPHSSRDDGLQHSRHHEDEPEIQLMAQKSSQQQTPPSSKHTTAPTRQEVLNYLGQLAGDYHVPRKLVYAVADAESSVNANIGRSPNFLMKNGQRVYKNGKPVILSWDYGLIQLNDKSRIGEKVKDPSGHPFTIGEDVKNAWRANARGAVAILAGEYEVAGMEQGPGATAEDHAQQTYSGYTHSHRHRDLYLREGHDGLPVNGKDRNFLLKYRQWSDQR